MCCPQCFGRTEVRGTTRPLWWEKFRILHPRWNTCAQMQPNEHLFLLHFLRKDLWLLRADEQTCFRDHQVRCHFVVRGRRELSNPSTSCRPSRETVEAKRHRSEVENGANRVSAWSWRKNTQDGQTLDVMLSHWALATDGGKIQSRVNAHGTSQVTCARCKYKSQSRFFKTLFNDFMSTAKKVWKELLALFWQNCLNFSIIPKAVTFLVTASLLYFCGKKSEESDLGLLC